MKKIILAVAFACTPAFAHDSHGHHAKKGAPSGAAAKAPASFEKQPAPGTWARCAVSGDVFQVGPDTQFATYAGRVYAFCCPDCKPDFEKEPAKYAGKSP